MKKEWNLDELNALRQKMDPAADAVIESIFKSKESAKLREVLAGLASNDSAELASFFDPKEASTIYNFLNTELNQKFTDYDIEMFEQASKIWQEHGVQFVAILLFRALPFTYVAEKPANVLRMTKLLEAQPSRRVFETAQFVFDVMDNEWWKPGKRGILTALKIRLMHASIRYMLLNSEGNEKYDEARWGKPINQEDMIGTNQVFSLEFFKGMELLGEPLTEKEQKAWFHTWKVIARIMGMEEQLLSDTVEEAWDLQLAIYKHLFSDEVFAGAGLSAALVQTISPMGLGTKFVLILMKKMMADQNFPESFERLLASTFGPKYGFLFSKPRSTDEADAQEEALNKMFMEELEAYFEQVKEDREKELDAKGLTIATRGEHDKNLVDYQLDEFDQILNEYNNPNITRGLMDDLGKALIRKAINAISGVLMVGLSAYYRQGKQAGFRISSDLKDHWAIK
jgi:hypothetical protein